jgi:hypothetical protein
MLYGWRCRQRQGTAIGIGLWRRARRARGEADDVDGVRMTQATPQTWDNEGHAIGHRTKFCHAAALLQGLLRCGHCGRKLKVRYGGDQPRRRYYCIRPIEEDNAGKVCRTISGKCLDGAISEEILRVLTPLGVEAALAAIDSGQDRNQDQRRQAELALEAARYEAGLARQQYDAVDPDNRLVAEELERRWNERL